MSPDDFAARIEARVSQLERQQARFEQQLADQGVTLHELAVIVRKIPEDLAVTKERVSVSIKRSNECLQKQEQLDDYLHERDREQARERKNDRKYLTGTVISSAAVVIAALGLLLDKF